MALCHLSNRPYFSSFHEHLNHIPLFSRPRSRRVGSSATCVINERGRTSSRSAAHAEIGQRLASSRVGFPLQSPSPLPQAQLPPTLGAVICCASLRCLWLPSGCLSGLRFSQTAASLQIIIGLGPAVWRPSTGSLLLIELDPDAGSDGENEQWSPSEPCDRRTQTEEVGPGSRGPLCFQ